MGAPAQQQPVYYDTNTSQYYTVQNPNQNQYSNPIANAFSGFLGGNDKRNYLGNPYSTNASASRFIPKTITPQYPDMNMLFPALNTGLLQGLMSSTQTDGAMSGAGRFLAPQTTNTQGK
jgi:hypothetical protein